MTGRLGPLTHLVARVRAHLASVPSRPPLETVDLVALCVAVEGARAPRTGDGWHLEVREQEAPGPLQHIWISGVVASALTAPSCSRPTESARRSLAEHSTS